MWKFLWKDAKSAGCTDWIPETWFIDDGDHEGLVHNVQNPQGGWCKAKCNVRVEGATVDLDYGRFAEFNRPRNIAIGVLRVQFTGKDRRTVSALLWKDLGSSDFQPTQTEFHSEPTPPFTLPDEVSPAKGVVEGAIRTITVNAYERDPAARSQCIAAHGRNCCVCGFSFAARYGPVADGYIHVHHLRPLSEVGGAHVVDPVEDLRPVCPNCHAVLHRRIPAYSIEEVQAFLR
jgi:hypothetical protein